MSSEVNKIIHRYVTNINQIELSGNLVVKSLEDRKTNKQRSAYNYFSGSLVHLSKNELSMSLQAKRETYSTASASVCE